jgi:hypothetical protein
MNVAWIIDGYGAKDLALDTQALLGFPTGAPN